MNFRERWYFYICVKPRSISQLRTAIMTVCQSSPYFRPGAGPIILKSRATPGSLPGNNVPLQSAFTLPKRQRSLFVAKWCAHDVVANYIIFVMGAPFEVQPPKFYVSRSGLTRLIHWKLLVVWHLRTANICCTLVMCTCSDFSVSIVGKTIIRLLRTVNAILCVRHI